MSMAQRVRDCRYSKGWGPDELASRAAISRTALYQIESGKTELPRAGTLRRIALALDVSMDALMGHTEGLDSATALHPQASASGSAGDWFPVEGAPLQAAAPRSGLKADDDAHFASECSPGYEGNPAARERDLMLKLHELMASPYGDAVARILDETHRLLPSAKMVAKYESSLLHGQNGKHRVESLKTS